MFKALVLEQVEGKTQAVVRELQESVFAGGGVGRCRVQFAQLQGWSGDHRQGAHSSQLAHGAGIDLVGVVLESADGRFTLRRPGLVLPPVGASAKSPSLGRHGHTRAREAQLQLYCCYRKSFSAGGAMQIGTAV